MLTVNNTIAYISAVPYSTAGWLIQCSRTSNQQQCNYTQATEFGVDMCKAGHRRP